MLIAFICLLNSIEYKHLKMGVMDFFKSKPVETATTLVTVVMAITSMVSCYKAYSTMKSASADFEDITINWNTQPLTLGKHPFNTILLYFTTIRSFSRSRSRSLFFFLYLSIYLASYISIYVDIAIIKSSKEYHLS